MYSRKVTEHNLNKAQALIKESEDLPLRWTMYRSTASEREEMNAHFNTLLDSKGFLIRDFTHEERLWILIESTYCKLDFLHFGENYGYIEDWSARIVTFHPNIAQQVILSLMSLYEERGWALMFLLLKARQLGMTTLFQVVLAHRLFFWENVGAYTGSAEEKKSRAMVGKLEFIWDRCPWWLRPRRTANQAGDFMKFGELNSGLWVQWGNQQQGIGRGSTPTIAHLSELSSFEHPEELVDAALYRAMHENPFALLALESTANGIGNWWYKSWYLNSRLDSKGLAKYKPVFLPWYIGSDLYPTESDLRRRPIPENWTPPEYVAKHSEAARTYVANTPMLQKVLGIDWELPLHQKWYYYLQYEEAREMKQLHNLLQELPANADEAFQNSNPSVFSIETLSETRNSSNSSVPEGVFQVAGEVIPFIYRDRKVTGKPISARAISNEGDLLETFDLEPIEMDGWPDSDSELKLYVWEWPQPGETYGVYCDPAEGVGLDSSVVGVIKKATPWHPDEQVAEWASNRVAPHDLWAYIYCLAHLYTVMGPNGEWNEPLVVVETNIAAGDAAQTEMMKRGYSNFYRQSDFTIIGETGAQYNKRPRAIKDRIGWRTDRLNRPRLISLFRKMVRDGNLIIRSPELVREMGTLEYNVDKQRIQAAVDQHDDRVMATGIMLCAWYDPEIYGTVPAAFVEQRAYEAQLERHPTYMGDKEIGMRARNYMPKEDRSDSRAITYE